MDNDVRLMLPTEFLAKISQASESLRLQRGRLGEVLIWPRTPETLKHLARAIEFVTEAEQQLAALERLVREV